MLKAKLEPSARKFIEKRPPKHRGQIVRKIDGLCQDPFPPDSKLLSGYSLLRADIGEYRITYRVEESILHVYVVGKRNDDEVYKQLKRLGG